VGSGQTNIAGGTYPVDLMWYVPVAEDEVDLHGAIFAQTASTDLTLTLLWELQANLFTLTGNAAVTTTNWNIQADTVKYSIPLDGNGNIVIPDLSTFHGLIQARTQTVGVGANEYRLIGQGAGKTLLRTYWQYWNGNAPQVPLLVNDTNFGEVGYRFGGNETPDDWQTSQHLRYWNERLYNVDIGAQWGYRCLDFAAMNAFRDAIDLGTTPDFRILDTIQGTAPALTNAAVEYVQETIFQAGQGASGAASTGTVGVAGPPAGQHAKAWHPDNAMFWVAGLIVIVFGIGGASTTFRVGSAKASAAVGKP
jgi:hypothetical protein